MGKEDLRQELQRIRSLGITNLKQFHFMGQEPLSLSEAELLALAEGVIPNWYGIGGWAEITPELYDRLGISKDLSSAEIQKQTAVLEYQEMALRERSERRASKLPPPTIAGGMGEPSRLPCAIPPNQVEAFIAWLIQQYSTPENAARHYKVPFDTVTWKALVEPFVAEEGNTVPQTRGWADFRRVRDVLRFQADRHFFGISQTAAWHREWDAEEPIRTGCHMIFENQAISGWDFEHQAQAIKEAGSFYASFHPAHHLKEVDGELDIPAYLTARLVNDFAKGIWTGMWESVGGPTNYSGSHAFYFDADSLTRCLLSYLAAGLKGVGVWCWNVRDYGWEIGEYGLCDLTGKPTARAEVVGAFARACETWRFELWEARDEPLVGVLYSWENDAAFARLSMGGYPQERLKTYPVRPSEARIGTARALIHANIPFEFVTERNLAQGLADRYQHIYIPHTICLKPETVRTLRGYAERGGHVLLDAPTLLINADTGNLFDTRQGSDFEQLFGFEHAGLQHTFNKPTILDGVSLEGQTFDVNVTQARIAAVYDGTERPAVLEKDIGAGRSTAFTFELSRLCFRPGNTLMENLLENYVLGWEVAPWRPNAERVLIYRRVAPQADHYFVINTEDRPQKVRIAVRDRPVGYAHGVDCLTGKSIYTDGTNFSLGLPPSSGRWVRMAKAVPVAYTGA
jgi:beta-galactosidase